MNSEDLPAFHLRIEKSCAIQLMRIRTVATSMVAIEGLVNDAKIDFFGMRDIGTLEASMRKSGKELEFKQIKLAREKDMRVNDGAFMRYMLAQIHQRFHGTIMYGAFCEKVEGLP
jgi:hypothetical protein